MGRLFVSSGSDEYLEKDVAPVGAAPLTMAGWARPTTVTGCPLSLADKDTDNERFLLILGRGAGSNEVGAFAQSDAAGVAEALSGNTLSTNTWHHVAARYVSASSRFAYLDGVEGTENTTTVTPLSMDRVSIGRSGDVTPSAYSNGRIEWMGLWNVALDPDELTALSRGWGPWRIRPANLVGCWSVWGIHSPEIDLTNNGNSLTVNGTPDRANGAPVELWTPQHATVPLIEAAAVGWGAQLSDAKNRRIYAGR